MQNRTLSNIKCFDNTFIIANNGVPLSTLWTPLLSVRSFGFLLPRNSSSNAGYIQKKKKKKATELCHFLFFNEYFTNPSTYARSRSNHRC